MLFQKVYFDYFFLHILFYYPPPVLFIYLSYIGVEKKVDFMDVFAKSGWAVSGNMRYILVIHYFPLSLFIMILSLLVYLLSKMLSGVVLLWSHHNQLRLTLLI